MVEQHREARALLFGSHLWSACHWPAPGCALMEGAGVNLPGQEMLAGFLGGRGAQPGPSPEVRQLVVLSANACILSASNLEVHVESVFMLSALPCTHSA